MAEALTDLPRREVDVRQLPDELAALWEQIEQSDDAPLCRVLTVNLIAVATAGDEDELRAALRRVLLRHPCRAFLVLLDVELDTLRVELGAGIRQEASSRQTCLEEITIRTSPRAYPRVAGVVRPLLVSDLPTHLFWAAAPPDNLWNLATMARLADRTVIDSCRFLAPDADLDRLASMRLPVVDLAFFRVRPWRRALAAAFEKFTWRRGIATEVTIEHAPDCGAIAGSRGLAAWLQQRLAATVHLRPLAADTPAPAMEPLRLELQHGEIHVLIEHRVRAPRLRATLTLGDRCLLPWELSASRGSTGDLLAAAIDAV